MKNYYTEPDFEIILYSEEDIVTTSGQGFVDEAELDLDDIFEETTAQAPAGYKGWTEGY